MTHRGSLVKRSSFVPAAADVQQEIDMKLGGEADAARPPSRSIVVTGPQSGGKSTFIWQLNILFSVEAAESERLKYKKELHKTALLAVQILLSSIDEGERARPRPRPSSRSGGAALGELSDLAARQACSYFLSRMSDLASPVFVPNPADLLYLDVRTAGRQETRLTGTPGGPLSVVEMSIEDFRQVNAFASSEERDARVAAVIYVDSVMDGNEELAGYRWQEVRGLACDAALPASVILSKSDLVALQGSSAVPEREVLLPRFGAPAKAVSLHNGLATRAASRAVFLELMSGPLQLSSSDDAAALEEGCYLGLAFFCAGGEGDDRRLP
ncbi:hypothetical protein EMIHUDRAFT_220033 [Emiliania huxleyi CCMP1516]|uniref:GTP-binding protein n=2 Tax=Emiliania huxleyi TaxID=2903 RepID=A0A0D3I2W8_EMIH1|nr:hypothetical protein EMIHUDRAFT_220033 [Emiliania huxleyi CCMP1516]EOD05603.1 hypothetical protein EMIHUDRAFT_220033 [Emiliania huxleyi CCMP1516]|eukprot:XP_005758032.1 hypothetical protein EMIHUDRAFT_220033 [Emiliania huxleyi CCMP1516]